MEPSAKSPLPMSAKRANGVSAPIPRSRRREEVAPCPEEGADGVLAAIREHLGELRYRAAQKLAREAAARFPDHGEIQTMHRALNDWSAETRPATGRDTAEEFEWLRHPPASAHGKWVALIGSQVVALAESLAEVIAALKSMDLAQTPLIHHVD